MKRKFFNKSIRNRILLGILAAPALSVFVFIPWSLNFIDKIDLIVLDMIMPRIKSIETFDRLQSINPAVKVIVSSGYSSDGHYQAVLKKGAKDFIQKPYNIHELYKMVRQVLDES